MIKSMFAMFTIDEGADPEVVCGSVCDALSAAWDVAETDNSNRRVVVTMEGTPPGPLTMWLKPNTTPEEITP